MGFKWTPPRSEREELIDSVEPSSRDFAASFTDISRINRYLGGVAAVQNPLGAMLRRCAKTGDQPVRILDIATGGADIPRALVRVARRGAFGSATRFQITATDIHPKVLQFTREQTPNLEYPEICVETADAFALPYADGAFDFALCSLAFHHFGHENCVRVLREMERVTTRGFIVNDLLRDRVPRALIWAVTRIARMNYLTCNDAPISVSRGYTRQEYTQMTRDAGIPRCQVRLAPLFRVVIVRDKQ